MKKIELDIVALSHSVGNTNNYAIVLGERYGDRKLPVVIGGFEAQAIAVAIERMKPGRPLTHDLFKSFMDTYHIKLEEVIISELVEGVFHAKLICLQKGGDFIEIDSRTSDALALAVRFECPIFTYDFILDSAGIAIEDSKEEIEEINEDAVASDSMDYIRQEEDVLYSYSIDALKSLLNDVLAEEDYEKAAKIRDEIERRGENS